jgi:hypothetical protein
MEMAIDQRNFCYARTDRSFALWGDWSLDTRLGEAPLRPLGDQPLTYPPSEVWGIFEKDEINFGPNSWMTRRQPTRLPLVTARISQMQAESSMTATQDQNNINLYRKQMDIARSQ